MRGMLRYLGKLWTFMATRSTATAIADSQIACSMTLVGPLSKWRISSAILFAMFFGVFELSFASYTYHYVAAAAREGARFAIVRGSTSCTNTPNLSNCNASDTVIGNFVKGLPYPGINAAANMTVTTTWLTATTDGSTGTT